MAVQLTLNDAIKAAIRATGGTAIDWTKSPFYKQVPDKPPAYPYVVFDVGPSSSLAACFEDTYQETFPVTVTVVAIESNIEALSAPMLRGSVFNYLDSLTKNPEASPLSSELAKCIHFLRQPGWHVDFDHTARAPNAERVWIGSASYEMVIVSNFGIGG